MFDTLSPDQEKLLDQLSGQMRVDAMSEGVHSFEAVNAINRLYASMGLKPPCIIFCDGPFQLGVMPLLLQLITFRNDNKKLDDLNIDDRVAELRALLTEPAWARTFSRLTDQISTTTICSLKYDDEPILPSVGELAQRFRWSRPGVSAGVPLFHLLQSSKAQAVNCLSQSVTLGLSAALTSRLYTRPIDRSQHIKKAVGQVLMREQSLSLRDSPTTIFGSSRGSMTALYRRAQTLHEQIAGTKFEYDLESCQAPQADARFRKPRNLNPDVVMNTASLFAFGPYDTLWGAWMSYSATCYAVIADMLRDQFTKEVRQSLSDFSLLMRCGFAFTPLTRSIFICRLPVVKLDEMDRLHCDDGPALQFPDSYSIYAWRGIPVPREIIEDPQTLTSTRIDEERNIELRRTLIDKFGIARYLQETSAFIRDESELGTLYLKQLPGDEPIALVRVRNSTAEADGTFKEYFLRVPPSIKSVREAIAWTFQLSSEQYSPDLET